MIKNRLAAGALVAGLLGGGVAGAVLGVPALVGAQDGTTTTTTDAPTTTAAPTTTEAPTSTVAPTTTTAPSTATPSTTVPGSTDDKGGNGHGKNREQHLKDVLAPLVANGTITQAQADKIIQALESAGGGKGFGHFGDRLEHGFGMLRDGWDTAAKTIGISSQDLAKALMSGQSIADVAKAHNVDPQKVIDALTAQAKANLDKQVAAGRLTQAEADQRLMKQASMISDLVNGKLPQGFGHGFGHFPGHGPADGSGNSNQGSDGSQGTTTD